MVADLEAGDAIFLREVELHGGDDAAAVVAQRAFGIQLRVEAGGDGAAAFAGVEAERGRIGESYNIGGRSERTNIDVVRSICALVNELAPDALIGDRANLITFVTDRPGHDARYAMDASKIEQHLGWTPRYSFENGLRETVQWYLANRPWWEAVQSGVYRGERLGLAV